MKYVNLFGGQNILSYSDQAEKPFLWRVKTSYSNSMLGLDLYVDTSVRDVLDLTNSYFSLVEVLFGLKLTSAGFYFPIYCLM